MKVGDIKIVDGITYAATKARTMYDPVFMCERQLCTGCIGNHNPNLCGKLQECSDDEISWVLAPEMYNGEHI